MEHHFKKVAAAAVLLTALTVFVKPVSAAAPDGMGPWADTVVSTAQGLRKDGSAVPAVRSDATSMLGVAEDDTVSGHFYSLGFGGTATLGFDNGIADGAFVVEATNPGYPEEQASVEVSEDGTTWYPAGMVHQDGTVPMPENLLCAKYVRITDKSNPANFSDATADAYDVDGVRADGRACTNIGKMTGGGSTWMGDTRITHGMELMCDGSAGNLQVNWAKNKFHLESLNNVLCFDDPALDPKNPTALFDSMEGWGTGKYNGTPGYHVHFYFTDNGEPGTGDQAMYEIWSPDYSTKLVDLATSYLKNGNQQAH